MNRSEGKSTRYYVDEFHLLLRGEVGAWSVEIWKRFRKWGGIPTGITQNIKDLLSSPEIENIFENSDFVYLASLLVIGKTSFRSSIIQDAGSCAQRLSKKFIPVHAAAVVPGPLERPAVHLHSV